MDNGQTDGQKLLIQMESSKLERERERDGRTVVEPAAGTLAEGMGRWTGGSGPTGPAGWCAAVPLLVQAIHCSGVTS